MRKLIAFLPAVFVFGSVSSFGAVPVARVISAEAIVVDGITAPARNYFPVALGGDVKTDLASAVVQFPNGNSVVLDRHSELKITGTVGKPVVRVIRGSARYELAANFEGSVSGGNRSGAVGKIAGGALAQASRVNQSENALTAAAIYGAPAGQSAGAIIPPSVVSAGAFAQGYAVQGIFIVSPRDTGPGSGPQIILPGGGGSEIINLTAQTNPTTGVVTYTVASISQEVILPGGGTQIVTVTNNNFLIGTTVGGINGATTSGSTAQITFTPVGQSTPLPVSTVATAITAVQTTAISQSPAGSTAPAATSVSTGQFSSSAS